MSQKLKLHPKRICILLDRALGYPVDSGERQRIKRSQLAGDHNYPRVGIQKRQEGLVHPVHPEDIDIEYPEKLLFGHLHQRVHIVDTRHVHDGIDRAGNLFHLPGCRDDGLL